MSAPEHCSVHKSAGRLIRWQSVLDHLTAARDIQTYPATVTASAGLGQAVIRLLTTPVKWQTERVAASFREAAYFGLEAPLTLPPYGSPGSHRNMLIGRGEDWHVISDVALAQGVMTGEERLADLNQHGY